MTDSNKNNKEEAKVVAAKPQTGRGIRLYLVLTSLLLIAFISLFFYTKDLVKEQAYTFNKKIQEITSNQESQTAQAMQKFDKLISAREDKLTKIQKQINTALKDSPYKTNDWLMQKARYYLELAKINNTWTNDYQTTQQLLAGADDTLQSLSNDDIVEVRKLIASEELSVNAASKLDFTKLLIELHAISKAAQDLKANKAKIVNQEDSKTNSQSASNSWQEHFKANLAKLNQLIIIRRSIDTPIHTLSPNYLAAIKANLQLNIQQMQWAVISHNQDNFDLGCKQALTTIKSSFNPDDPQTKAVIEKLENMQDTNLSITKAKLGGALSALEKLIADTNSVDEE